MKEQSTKRLMPSRPSWEDVEAFARQRIQTWLQRRLEEEVLIAERTVRRLDAAELPAEVAEGVRHVNGVRQRTEERTAAA